MSDVGVPQNDSRHTYFYIFMDRDSNNCTSNREDTDETTPDRAVQQAFNRLSKQYSNAEVCFNASDALRRALGIESLPAFAISDSKLPIDGSLRDKPTNPPSVWNLLKFRERKRILESGKHVPTVERAIISLYKTPDRLYQFVRDLHLKHLDRGIVEASRMVESEVRKIGGRKLLNAVALTKKVFF